jgi:hypothetical protein
MIKVMPLLGFRTDNGAIQPADIFLYGSSEIIFSKLILLHYQPRFHIYEL